MNSFTIAILLYETLIDIETEDPAPPLSYLLDITAYSIYHNVTAYSIYHQIVPTTLWIWTVSNLQMIRFVRNAFGNITVELSRILASNQNIFRISRPNKLFSSSNCTRNLAMQTERFASFQECFCRCNLFEVMIVLRQKK